MSVNDTCTVKVFRYDPAVDSEPRMDTFEGIPYRGMRVLDVLNYIYQNIDSSLAFRYSCRAGLCGACLLRVNGKNVMSCKELASEEMTIEPPRNHRVIKDLVVDFREKAKAG